MSPGCPIFGPLTLHRYAILAGSGDAKSVRRALWGEGAPISAKPVGATLIGLIFPGALES